MIIKKDKVIYHGNEYDAVWVTLEDGEQTANTNAGVEMLFADYQLWLDIVGDETLNSDRPDLPQDEEGEKVDEMVYFYDIAVLYYCWDKMTDEEFKKWVLDNIE